MRMKMPHVVGTTPRGHGSEIRIVWDAYNGRNLLHTRQYYDVSGDMKPGKGLAVPADLVPWFRAQLEAAERVGIEAGLIEIEDYTNHDLPLPESFRPKPLPAAG